MKRKDNYKKILNYFKNKTHLIIIYIVLALLISGVGFISPYINSKLIIFVTNVQLKNILLFSIISVFVELTSSILRNLSNQISTKIRDNVSLKLKKDASKELFNIEVKNFDKEGTAFFTNIIEREPEAIAGIFDKLQYSITSLLTNLGVFFYVFIISWQIGIVFIIFAIINGILTNKRMKNWQKFHEFIISLDSKYSSNFSELIRGIRDIKVLNLKNSLLNKTTKEQENYKKEMFNYDRERDREFIIMDLFYSISDFVILALGVLLITKNKLSGANLLIIYMYKNRAFSAFRNITDLYESITNFNISIDRLFGIIDGTKYSKEKFGKKQVKELKGNIEIKDLNFAYDKNRVLKNLSLSIKGNTTVGFVGKSGQGKTTIFNCLSKLYSVDNNTIFFDGIDINNLTESSIRNNISVITQNPYIFNMTIRENLKIAKQNLSEKEMIKICKMCSLHDFIMTLPDKYDTKIGENGVILSGGQKQRLAIARSIVKKSNIILLDEATSSLDNETQDHIQDSIKKLSKKYTILIIAHRLSTVRDCNKIFFIDKGKVIASGTHEELVDTCIKYKNLYKKELK